MKQEINTDRCNPSDIRELPVDPESLEQDFNHTLIYHLGRFLGCNPYYLYETLSLVIRKRVMTDWRNTWLQHKKKGVRRAYYMSLEFLIGRSLGNHLLNLGLEQQAWKTHFDMQPDFTVDFGGGVDVFRSMLHCSMINSATEKRMAF